MLHLPDGSSDRPELEESTMAYSDWNNYSSMDRPVVDRLGYSGRLDTVGTNALSPYSGIDRGGMTGMDPIVRENRQSFAGRGPRGYRRSDTRIAEDVNERLTWHPDLDATDIEVRVANGEVTLGGIVEDRRAKRLAEDIVEDVVGVSDVHNELKVRHGFLAGLTGEKADEQDLAASDRDVVTRRGARATTTPSDRSRVTSEL
jgi:osmotically-inducible protein OsmY